MNTHALVTEFTSFLSGHNLRMTAERRNILHHIFAAHTHFEADDLHVRLRQAGHRIARATVYRTLSLLVEANILREVVGDPGSTSTHYELVHGLPQSHEHLRCEDCGQIVEVSDVALAGHLRRIALSMGFDLTDYTVRLAGRCEELARTGSCSKAGAPAKARNRTDESPSSESASRRRS